MGGSCRSERIRAEFIWEISVEREPKVWRSVWTVTKEAVQDFGRDDVMTKAAALAFYSALGLAPTILLVLTVTAWLRPGAEEAGVNQVESMVGSQAAKVVAEVVKSTKEAR